MVHRTPSEGISLNSGLFHSFFLGGFESATHQLRSGKRLDLIATTEHDKHVVADYLRLSKLGIYTIRDGVRWHLVEQKPGRFHFSSVLSMVRAAHENGIQVIWDLCHYGWPNGIDLFRPEFIKRFVQFTRKFVTLLREETDAIPFITPINEISYFSWASGEVGYIYPFATNRGDQLKIQLVRAMIESIEAVWDVNPRARIVNVEPAINVIAHPTRLYERKAANNYHRSQYEARDMLLGLVRPELGGNSKYLDIIGVNYYPFNQWYYGDTIRHLNVFITRSEPLYRPFSSILYEINQRYSRPIFVAETGAEDDERPGWLSYVMHEVRVALKAGVPIDGVCWYPILNHPGWDDDRHCYNGLWDYANGLGEREIYEPLAQEFLYQMQYITEENR